MPVVIYLKKEMIVNKDCFFN